MVILHFICLLLSFRTYGVAELVIAFIHFKYQIADLASPKVFVAFPISLF